MRTAPFSRFTLTAGLALAPVLALAPQHGVSPGFPGSRGVLGRVADPVVPEQGHQTCYRHGGTHRRADQDLAPVARWSLQDDVRRLLLPGQRNQVARQRLPERGWRFHRGQRFLQRGAKRLNREQRLVASWRPGRSPPVCASAQERDSGRSASEHVLSHSSGRSTLTAPRKGVLWCPCCYHSPSPRSSSCRASRVRW